MLQSVQTSIGVDLHKCTVSLGAVDAGGVDVSKLKISTKSTGKIEDWLLTLPRSSHMAVEACTLSHGNGTFGGPRDGCDATTVGFQAPRVGVVVPSASSLSRLLRSGGGPLLSSIVYAYYS